MRMSKKLIEQNVYGALRCDGTIIINTPLLFKHSKNEECFINNFCKIDTHERLHKEIRDAYFELMVNGDCFEKQEEQIVDKISGSLEMELNEY